MDLTREQRRALVALACKVAWADGKVTVEERKAVVDLGQRFSGGQVSLGEVSSWLENEPPDAEIQQLPETLGQLFFYEALKIMEADGDLADVELQMLESIMTRVFKAHPEETQLARIALAQRAVPLPRGE